MRIAMLEPKLASENERYDTHEVSIITLMSANQPYTIETPRYSGHSPQQHPQRHSYLPAGERRGGRRTLERRGQ